MTAVNPGAGTNSTANVAGKLYAAWVDTSATALVGPSGQNVSLGGGGVVISAGANFASTGTVNFSNANGVTFGMDALGNVTATVIPGAAAGLAAVQAGTQTQTSGTLVFSNSNGITFGLSNSSVLTASYTVPTQSVQTQASGAIAGTGFTSTTTAGVVIVGTNSTNGLSLGIPNYITTYVAQTTQTQPAGNIAGAGTTTTTQGGSTLGATQNSNGLSLAVPLWITTYVGQSTQTQPAGNIAGIGTTTTTQGGSTLGATLSTNGLSLAVPAWLTAAAGGGGFTGGVSTGGNTLGNTGSQTGSIFFAGGNNITLSVSTAAGGAQTITISGANAGGAQTGISGIADANGTQTVGTVSFANSNGFTFGLSTGANTATMTASYTVPATAGLISGLNVSGGAGNSQSKVSGMTFNNANGLTFGVSTGASVVTITGSYTVPTVTNSSWTVSDANTSATVGRLAFTQANGITMSLSTSNNGNHTVFASYTVPTVPALSFGVSTGGNTAGNTGTYSGQVILVGSNNITASVGTAAGGAQTITLSGPTLTQYFSNTATTFNGANVSGSMTLNTAGLQVSLSAAAGGGQTTGGLYALGNTTQNSSSTLALSAYSFNALGAMTMGFSNGSIQVSAPATSSISVTGNLSISVNGSTISIGGIGAGTGFTTGTTSGVIGAVTINTAGISSNDDYLTRYIWPPGNLTAISTPANATASFQYVNIPNPLTGTRIDALMGISGGSAATTATGALVFSAYAVIYTRNAQTLSSLSSGSTQTTYTYASNTAGNTELTQSAIRPISVPVNFNMAPGEYVVGFNIITNTSSIGLSTTNYGVTMSMYGGNQIQTAINYGEFGSGTATSTGLYGGMGLYASASTGMPTAASFSAIAQTGASLSRANIALVFRNA